MLRLKFQNFFCTVNDQFVQRVTATHQR